jgi:hypothetical protein
MALPKVDDTYLEVLNISSDKKNTNVQKLQI